jgi:hypothetical protein
MPCPDRRSASTASQCPYAAIALATRRLIASRMRSSVLVALIVVLFAPFAASARTTAKAARVCPFTEKPFTATVEMSGTRVCTRLDLKPVGFVGAPPLMPICPDDGFVLYKPSFSPTEIATLRPWVESDDFRRLAREESPYFRIALTQEKLSAPPDEIALSYVAASWEVESDPERYRRYVLAALAILDSSIVNATPRASAAGTFLPQAEATLLSAELMRRVGQFDAARERLQRLNGTSDAQLAKILAYELELVEARDTAPHFFQREDEARCAMLDQQQRSAPVPEPEAEAPQVTPPPTAGSLPSDKLRP